MIKKLFNLSATIAVLCLISAAANAALPAPNDPRIGRIFLLKEEKAFYRYNPWTKLNETILLERGTRVRLDQINETPATQNSMSYWNFTVMPSANSSQFKYQGSMVWLGRPKFTSNTPPAQRASSFFAIQPGRVWAPACTNFFDEAGNLGTWGRDLVAGFSNGNAMLADSAQVRDLKSICPAFGQFDSATQKKLVTYFVASMAMSESGCNARSRARGPNGTLAGLLQLHLGREGSYGCGQTSSFNPISNLRCGMTMLKSQVRKYGNFFIPRGKTYWQVLWAGSRGAARVKSRLQHLCGR